MSAMPPSTPNAATTEIAGSFVKIDWETPDENYSTITAYQILIKDADGNFLDDIVACDGSDTSIRQATECLVPLSTLIGSKFRLT